MIETDKEYFAYHGHHRFSTRYPKPTAKQPSLDSLERQADSGVCKATDGCRVEPDGTCPHGHVSWLIYLGYI